MITPLVIDMNHDDSVTDFAAVAASGIVGVIHKASTGATGKDSLYTARKAQAKAAGLLWGAYHWGTAANVDAQIANFLSVINPAPNPLSALDGTLIALDFEKTKLADGTDDTMSLDQAREFLLKLGAKLQRKPVLYGGGMLNDDLGDTIDPVLGSHKLWLANYNDKPTWPKTWNDYWLWQFTGDGQGSNAKKIPGAPGDKNGYVDCSMFPAGADALKTQWAT
ncbi:MAG TPA: glycoside hydrolase family 25 protein [Rhizomicrobium sp.]|jgi:GH25 family lysozyme M1 (1,4-beta-N-acetylmuramidase)